MSSANNPIIFTDTTENFIDNNLIISDTEGSLMEAAFDNTPRLSALGANQVNQGVGGVWVSSISGNGDFDHRLVNYPSYK